MKRTLCPYVLLQITLKCYLPHKKQALLVALTAYLLCPTGCVHEILHNIYRVPACGHVLTDIDA